jgi:hypothetical protein
VARSIHQQFPPAPITTSGAYGPSRPNKAASMGWRSPPLSALRPCTLLRPDPRSRAKSRQAASSPHRRGLADPIRRRTPATTRSLHRTARPIVLRHAMPWPYRKVNRDASTTVHRDTDTHAVEHQQTNPPVHRSIRHNENVTSGYVRASEVNQ